MAGWQNMLENRRPELPAMPPPKRQRQLDDSAAPVSGATSAALLAGAQQPPWMPKARAAREAAAERWAQRGRPSKTARFLNRPTPGLQPPPVRAFGNPKAVAKHAYLWNGESTMAAHFRPDRHSCMIMGRPVQARGG